MIREIAMNELDPTDNHIVSVLRRYPNSCKIGAIVAGANKSEGSVRYRLLTLEACGVVHAIRERGSTTYFLNFPGQSI